MSQAGSDYGPFCQTFILYPIDVLVKNTFHSLMFLFLTLNYRLPCSAILLKQAADTAATEQFPQILSPECYAGEAVSTAYIDKLLKIDRNFACILLVSIQ